MDEFLDDTLNKVRCARVRKFAWRAYKVLKNHRPYVSQIIRRWAEARNAEPQSADGYVLYHEPLIPIPDRVLDLDEKYAIVCAVVGFYIRGFEKADPWPESGDETVDEEPDKEAVALWIEAMPYKVLVHGQVQDLIERDVPALAACLADVEADLHKQVGIQGVGEGSTAPDASTPAGNENKQEDFAPTLDDIPPLDKSNGEWVKQKEAAKIEGRGTDTLTKERHGGLKDGKGLKGISTHKNAWRKESANTKTIWYYKPSLSSKTIPASRIVTAQ